MLQLAHPTFGSLVGLSLELQKALSAKKINPSFELPKLRLLYQKLNKRLS
jgi:hypothetical protein